MIRRISLQSLFLLMALNFIASVPSLADGGKAKNVVYSAWEQSQTGNGGWQFGIDTSPIIFYLGTVNNKYHVLLIRVRNNTDAPLNLAKDQDTIELRFSDNRKVTGLLNLPATDRISWEGLEREIRAAVVYPLAVPPREEEGIYVYVPIGEVRDQRRKHEMPDAIIYTIKSLPGPIKLRQPATQAKQ